MKADLPKCERLSEEEKKVLEWAFNFVHSIIAGDYNLPKPMIFAMNNLKDAVWELSQRRGISIEDGCSKEYLGFYKGYMDGINEYLSPQRDTGDHNIKSSQPNRRRAAERKSQGYRDGAVMNAVS